MSAKDFTINQTQLDALVEQNDLVGDFARMESIYGCLAVQHTSETRVDLLTFDLAYLIAGYAYEDDLMTSPLVTVRQIMADLEPKTRHHSTRSVTFWENVGIREKVEVSMD